MKKEKSTSLVLLLCLIFVNTTVWGQILITEIADPKDNLNARYLELYNYSNTDIDLNSEKYALRRWTNSNTTPNSDVHLNGIIPANSFFLIAAKEDDFYTTYFINSNFNTNLVNSNGDDTIALIKNNVIVDIFGIPGEDGTNTCHEFKDGRAERTPSITTSNAIWIESEWNVWADNMVNGCTSHTNTPRNTTHFDPGKWIGAIKTGITLGNISSNTNENGDAVSFTAVLDKQPTTNVILNIVSDNTNEIISSPSELTFTNLDWNTPQTITLTGVDDPNIDGEVDVTITISVNNSSSDNEYNGVNRIIVVTNEDNELSPIIINEIHADPDVTNGDANGDGNISNNEDEFIEIYNTSGANLNISGWILADNQSDRHIFPYGTIIPANETIVVFGGGNPITIPGLVQVASSGRLSLNNGGDTVKIKNELGNVIINEIYGNTASKNQSIARSIDITGPFIKHSSIASNSVLFSPGRNNSNNDSFSSTIKWIGFTDTNWTKTTNWLDGIIPSTTSDIIIPADLTNYPTISSALTINSILLKSGATLIANAQVTGMVTYERNITTTNWHLMSSPVSGTRLENIITNNSLAIGMDDNIGYGTYLNMGTKSWDFANKSSTGSLENGTGFSVKLATPERISFKGNLNSTNINTNINLGSRNNFNLIGNPFTSYINSTIFTANNTDKLSEQTVWLWNGNNYETHNAMNPIEIAPAQGFFIDAVTTLPIPLNDTYGRDLVTFAISNQSHQTNNTFKRENPKTMFELFISDGNHKKSTKVFYAKNKTTGFDNGYDSKIFDGDTSELTLFSELISENKGKKLAIQTLPDSNYEEIIIPIGLISEANKEIEFTIHTQNLPTGIKIYLEDRSNNTFTNLPVENYTTKLKDKSDGVGQFYIHTSFKSLSGEKIITKRNKINLYKSNNREITITGLQGKANINVYSILGEELMSTQIISNSINKIEIPNFSMGIYIVKLNTEKGILTKKIILK